MQFLFGMLLLMSASASLADVGDLPDYIPTVASFEAEYVVIERDPELDEFNRRFGDAMATQPEWFRSYAMKHRGQDPLPYHPNFGIPEKQYARLNSPIDHFREVSRQQIRVEKQVVGAVVELRFHGQDLLFDKLQIETDSPTVITPTDTIVFRSVVDLERASLPPAVHQGVLFNTSEEKIRATRSRESILVGALKGTSTGVLHYELKTEHGNDRAYVTYSLEQ